MQSVATEPHSLPSTSRWPFVATICLGSFLLFLVQPMVARMALPRLGGAPAVWNSAMLVYQALLLGGYGYADWLGRLAGRRQAILHLGLFALAGLMLPLHLFAGSLPEGASPFLWVPWLLLGSIGPLFFVVSAQAPLIQRWFSLAGGGDPYPLYAASNLGSFAGLIAYPLLVEPNFAVVTQRWLWSGGYVLLLLAVAGVALLLPKAGASAQGALASTPAPSTRSIARWILLAAIPSGLMLSTTLHLTTDIMAMPLIWVIPLGLYLLSFTVAFADRRGPANVITRIAPIILLLAGSGVFVDTTNWPISFALLSVANLFCVAVALHARMYAERPDAEHLTRFYLAMSIGGVVGGIFCALIAPLVFDWSYEHPLLLLAAAAALALQAPEFLAEHEGLAALRRPGALLPLVILIAGAALIGASPLWPEHQLPLQIACSASIIVIAVLTFGNRRIFLVSLLGVLLCLGGLERLRMSAGGFLTRSYFGIYTVREYADVRYLVHGTTVHGIQSRDPALAAIPNSYYAPFSGVGLAMKAVPSLYGPYARVGLVGLGSGTLTCYAEPRQVWRIYEIDPAIAGIAQDPKRFTFLSKCLPHPDIVFGDARLTLARAATGGTDVLAIDAFSSDSIPMHLLTREAFADYRRILAANGLLMVHISNRMLDLRPVIAAAAARGGWFAAERFYNPTIAERQQHLSASIWIAMSPSKAVLDQLIGADRAIDWQPVAPRPGFADWTDDFASILPLVKWQKGK
jgi:hypothetical protein